MHAVGGTALAERAQGGGIPKHVLKWNTSRNDLAPATWFQLTDLPSATAQIPDHFAHIFLRHHYFYSHDRLEQDWLGLRSGILEGHGAGDLKRNL